MTLRLELRYYAVKFVVSHNGSSAVSVEIVDDSLYFGDERIFFIYAMLFGKRVIRVEPVSYARESAMRIYTYYRRLAEYFFRIEYIIYFLVLKQSVRMYARSRRIETPAYERRSRRNNVLKFLFEVSGYLRYALRSIPSLLPLREAYSMHIASTGQFPVLSPIPRREQLTDEQP